MIYDTGNNKAAPGWGCGNHNVMVTDVDDDGKQEVCKGASMIDDNGKLLWTTGTLHGDAMHLSNLISDREGQKLWICHEDKPYGESCIDAKTGKTIFNINVTKDTGGCTADKINTIFTANGCSGNNSSKNVPCITADLFSDWREDLIMRTSDNNSIRIPIWCTTDTTKVRLTTLIHDMQYRMQNGCQQSCYNQPPHVSYYLGSEDPLPARHMLWMFQQRAQTTAQISLSTHLTAETIQYPFSHVFYANFAVDCVKENLQYCRISRSFCAR